MTTRAGSNLSVVVLTYNNEDIIARFVQSVTWADELVVVDSGSTDNTVDVAKAIHFNCRVLERNLDNFAAQRNFGLDHATGHWVMHCDSDHIVPEPLAKEIQALVAQADPPFQVYNAFQYLYWQSRLLSHASGPFGTQGLLHRRGVARFAGQIHEKLVTDQPVGMLHNRMVHVTYKTLNELLQQCISYADKEVVSILAGERPIHKGKVNIFWRPMRRLISSIVLKRAYRDGIPGMAWAVIIAFRSFLIQFKYWLTQQSSWGDYEGQD